MASPWDDLGANLRREACFAIEIITIFLVDGVVTLTLLGVIYVLDYAANLMGLAEGNIIRLILHYAHAAVILIYIFFSLIHLSIFLKDRRAGGKEK